MKPTCGVLTSNRAPTPKDKEAITDAKLYGLTLINKESDMQGYPRLAIITGRVGDKVDKTKLDHMRGLYTQSLQSVSAGLVEINTLKETLRSAYDEKEELSRQINNLNSEKHSSVVQISELEQKLDEKAQQIKELRKQLKKLDPQVTANMNQFIEKLQTALEQQDAHIENLQTTVAQRDTELSILKDQQQRDQQSFIHKQQKYKLQKKLLTIGDVAFSFEDKLVSLFNELFGAEEVSFAAIMKEADRSSTQNLQSPALSFKDALKRLCQIRWNVRFIDIRRVMESAKDARKGIAHPILFGQVPEDLSVLAVATEFNPNLGKIAETLNSWDEFCEQCKGIVEQTR